MSRAAYLADLGTALGSRFDRTGQAADLDEAIDLWREAVAAISPDDAHHATVVSKLGAALQTRFERTGRPADLDDAIRIGREGVGTASREDPQREWILSNLGASLSARFDRTGRLADLEDAIGVGREALASTSPEQPDRHRALSNLGIALRSRFSRTGELADLGEAITLEREAVAATPPEHADRAGLLSNLGTALVTRFELTGQLADLDEAIRAGKEAVAADPQDPDRAAHTLSTLGSALSRRFAETGQPGDLDEAIGFARQAVAAIGTEHPDRPIVLSNLGSALSDRFDETGRPGDLEEALRVGREALAAMPSAHPERARCLSNLAMVVSARFERTGDPGDLNEAVGLVREAVDATPPDHPDRSWRLLNLSRVLESRFETSREPADLEEAIRVARDAAAVATASPRRRAQAARRWGHLAGVGERWDEAARGFAAAVELLGQVAPRRLTRHDQERLLGGLGGLGSDAAACCVRAGMADRAVELFEQGRGVLLGQALDTRTDMTALAARHPELADRFTALRDELDQAEDSTNSLLSPSGTHRSGEDRHLKVERRREAADALERTIAEIRARPEFADFLRPRTVRELATAAADGPVILVNVSRFGSHALILTAGGVQEPVALDGLTPDRVRDHVFEFFTALAGLSVSAADSRLVAILGWLWEVLAGPVLDRLSVDSPSADGESWTRVWWCVSGLLSFLPVHAAGHHDTRRAAVPATVIDRVISSYTPTIRALAHARRNGTHADGPSSERAVVVVAMPHTPDAADLPGAQAEAELLQQRFPARVTVLDRPPDTNHSAVLALLPRAQWAHFACHGFSDLTDPSASRLLLSDHRRMPLTVVDIARLHLEGAELAFLSACSTAMPGVLTDEAIHLASAFQLAGYRHVIATLWPIDDQNAVTLAGSVYRELGDRTLDAAAALHAATRQLRARWSRMPSVWASHIHSGA